ncbi:MAG: LutB/LldF family L-lactate oxidation iron-sulfur protein [Eggerthellaceae bacterium]|jgi:L-lactate dehydrogenase complex protein LldF|nr:LutB/LldF family L-lactate oxidation iron-sulfur protein [Eggerthellaceae bacterium]MCH4220622.1 LutB/LldF family L-lactate oxidation iron-sulfur protein [Eggerthellaceae bacterium]
MKIYYGEQTSLEDRTAAVLSDDFKHQAIERAQDIFYKKRLAAVQSAGDWEGMRKAGRTIRAHTTQYLDYYVSSFIRNAEKNGAHVYVASKGQQAVQHVLDIIQNNDAHLIVKSKSMMSEEIELNEAIEHMGIPIVETDCAEHILQTAHDKPSHIVVPALHLDRTAISKLYQQTSGYKGSNEPEQITHFLRTHLRPIFLKADIGISGCNFGIASTGSVTLVSNEGNGRMANSVPPIHIVLVGIDRIIPDLYSLDLFTSLLVRSAVGSKMTSYVSISTGAKDTTEVDGPSEVHYIVIDNGRSSFLNSDFEAMLRCIRCGACLNICPVYRHITGHGYGSIYPGPMGVVMTTRLADYAHVGDLPYACSLCGACDDHCPVSIPLHSLIRLHRIHKINEGYGSKQDARIFSLVENVLSNVALYSIATHVGAFGMKCIAHGKPFITNTTSIAALKSWTDYRDLKVMPKQRFRTWFKHRIAEENR